MGKLTAQEAAIMRMAMHDETRALRKDMTNTSLDIGAQYPRMLYRATLDEVRKSLSVDKNGKEQEFVVRNAYDGLLCDTVIAETADDAETLAADGWDTSPQAAHGMTAGLVTATTAKDDQIAALKAQLAASLAGAEPAGQPPRGPGRPRKEAEPA